MRVNLCANFSNFCANNNRAKSFWRSAALIPAGVVLIVCATAPKRTIETDTFTKGNIQTSLSETVEKAKERQIAQQTEKEKANTEENHEIIYTQKQNAARYTVDTMEKAADDLFMEHFWLLAYYLGREDEYCSMNELINLCEDKNFGNGKVDPILLVEQMTKTISQDRYLEKDGGIGQLSESDVDKINKLYNTNYEYSDRKNLYKNIEMMVLMMRHCIEQTNSYEEALAMYHTGNPEGINTTEGKEYAEHVISRLDNYVIS